MITIKNSVRIRRLIRFLKSRFEHVDEADKKLLKNIQNEFPHVLSTKETLDMIIEKKVSISRYGDAEFDICNQENKDDIYQRPSDELTKRLTEILTSNVENLLVCIPPFNAPHNNIKNYYGCLSFWEKYWLEKYDRIKPLLKLERYGNSFISRDSIFYENELNDIKKIWGGRDVVYVYGEGGRFNENSEIFDNIKSSQRILVPSQSAFDVYNEILEKCMTKSRNSLFLIAAGPTACVLAYDLSLAGYQALDVGHIPNCYDQYLGRIVSPEALPLNNKTL